MSSTIDQSNKIALTQYSKGAGCGCKIAPSVLSEILAQHSVGISTPKLLVGNDTKPMQLVMSMQWAAIPYLL